MGRSYWFECARCGYRARVSGRADRGLNFFVQTIHCRDCKELYDAVTRVRMAEGAERNLSALGSGLRLNHTSSSKSGARNPPSFQAALNRLLYAGASRWRWVDFPLRCPISQAHRVKSWTEPDKCPRCGLYLEKNVLPYRLWD